MSVEEDMDLVNQDAAEGENDELSEPGSNGGVAVSINLLRSSLTRKLERLRNVVSGICESHGKLNEKVDAIGQDVSDCAESVREIVEFQKAFQVRPNPRAKRKTIPRIRFQDLNKVVSFNLASRPLLKFSIISTVLSFVHAMPCVRFWVSDDMWSKMFHYASVLSGSQGFAAILFSMRNNEKSLASTAPGKLWMFIVSGALQAVLSSARSKFRRAPTSAAGSGVTSAGTCAATSGTAVTGTADRRPVEPDWLAKFKSDTDVVSAVVDSMNRFSGVSNDVALSSGTLDAESQSGSGRRLSRKRKNPETEAYLETIERRDIVSQIRSSWLEPMSNCRQQVRKHLYLTLTSVLDKIVRHKSISKAREKGYEVILNDYESYMEDVEAEQPSLEESIWDIKDAHVDHLAAKDQRNMQMRKELERKFPSLHCKIVYKREIRSVGDGSPPNDGDTTGSGQRVESKTEEVSFHELAHGILMEAFLVESMESTLAVSELSLKAVHVIALALRGLVATVLNAYRDGNANELVLSAAEKAAFGSDVTLDDESGHKFMVMLERTAANGKLSELYSKCYASKFQTTELEIAKESRRAATREREERPGSSGAHQRAQPLDMSLLGAWTEKK